MSNNNISTYFEVRDVDTEGEEFAIFTAKTVGEARTLACCGQKIYKVTKECKTTEERI